MFNGVIPNAGRCLSGGNVRGDPDGFHLSRVRNGPGFVGHLFPTLHHTLDRFIVQSVSNRPVPHGERSRRVPRPSQ